MFVTMELLDGETLAEYIQRRGPLPIEEVLDIATQLCAGLNAAHQAGVIHRDFKTGNAMLTRLLSSLIATQLALGRDVEARAIATELAPRIANTESPSDRLRAMLARARVTKSAGELRRVAGEAKTRSLILLQLEAEIALARLENDAQRLGQARAEAARRGLKRIAAL